jgi:NADH dehydrogenase
MKSKKVFIIGGGFAGIELANKLCKSNLFEVTLIDKNNYHQFQPLFYQVATSGLEPSSISFPLRKLFQNKNLKIRVAEVTNIDSNNKIIKTSIGDFNYDYIVIAIGADTNYFGMQNIEKYAYPMKSTTEAMQLRNKLLQNLEDSLTAKNEEEKKALLNIVIVGGGPTGVEVAGTLAEMKKHVLPKDYPEINFSEMKIFLIEAAPKTLNVMSEVSAKKSQEYLEKLGVKVLCSTQVKDYDGNFVLLDSGEKINTKTLIWAAGVKANKIDGLPESAYGRGGRLKVNQNNLLLNSDSIFALGDCAIMESEKYPNGHPQMAQPAIQQGKLLSKNLINLEKNLPLKEFQFKDLGSMATIGRNLAVVDLPWIKFQGFFAWLVWMFLHLMSILGVKNKLLVFINWLWNYVTYDQSLRLILKTKEKKE